MATDGKQRVLLGPDVVRFTVLCEACLAECEPKEGRYATVLEGELPLSRTRESATCPHGHAFELVRVSATRRAA
ncbi:MAG: hypothetical protein ABSC51_08425 [Gaiellaceae bacterium]|jgi:hypothetical protein